MQKLTFLLLAAASTASLAAAPAPRLWEAVRPNDPGVHIYILAATSYGLPLEYDSYFDQVVLPAFEQADVLHYEGAGGPPPDSYPACPAERIAAPEGAVAFSLRERRPQMRVADLEPAAVPGMRYCSMGKGRITLAPLAGNEAAPGAAEGFTALVDGEFKGGAAAQAALNAADICPRNARWLRLLTGLRDGRTHFVVADARHVRDVKQEQGGCKGILNGLWDAGFVVWPVAEFKAGSKRR
ncbi:hypothetical protein [Pseudoduganella rhizocola]|uniref:hypothetical protein n=1 Tax=Pseudoduganella rhizocola TaxID=3382643 RepID=UPI0038B5527A